MFELVISRQKAVSTSANEFLEESSKKRLQFKLVSCALGHLTLQIRGSSHFLNINNNNTNNLMICISVNIRYFQRISN